MYKKSLFALALTGILLLPACSFKDFFSFDFLTSKLEDGTEIALDVLDPSTAIDSLNTYVDFLNVGNDQMSILQDDLYYFEMDMNDYANISYEPSFYCSFGIYDYENYKTEVLNPYGLTADEAGMLTGSATDMIATIDATETACKELSAYVTAQDYKDDNFEKAKTLVAELYANVDTYYVYHEELLNYTDELFDIYETWEVDPSDPASVGLGNISDDLDLAETVFDLIEYAYEESSFDKFNELQTAYDSLLASTDAHSGTASPAIYDTYLLEQYNYFYDEMAVSFLPTAKRAIRNFNELNLESLYTDYSDILTSYNTLVDDYNYYLDSMEYGY